MKKLTLSVLKRAMKELDLKMEDLEYEENVEKLTENLKNADYISYRAYQMRSQNDSWIELRVYIQLNENISGLFTFNNNFYTTEDIEQLLEDLLFQEKRAKEILKITNKK